MKSSEQKVGTGSVARKILKPSEYPRMIISEGDKPRLIGILFSDPSVEQ